MKIQSFEFNLFGEQTYLIWNESSKEGVIVDPGMSNDVENNKITEFISNNGIKLKYILYTHLHIDHTFGHEYIKSTYSIPTIAHQADASLGESRQLQAQMFHLRTPELLPLIIDSPISDNEEIILGDEKLIAIHIPGHTQGSIAYFCPTSQFVITGDALFYDSIGRTDLPGGNYPQLISSIQKRLLTLPNETKVYPGHGPSTTIGREIASNPFL